MRKRRKLTPEEVVQREAKKARQRRFAELLEQRLKQDAELAAARGPDEGPPRLRPMTADEIPTEAARRERTLYFRELMAWSLKRDEELAAREQPDT